MFSAFVKWSSILIGATVLSSCAPYEVHTDYDREVSFSQMRTFAWMDSTRPRSEQSGNPFLERRVKRAVEQAMTERGLSSVDAGQADVLVTAFVIGPSRQDIRASRSIALSCGPSMSVARVLHRAVGRHVVGDRGSPIR